MRLHIKLLCTMHIGALDRMSTGRNQKGQCKFTIECWTFHQGSKNGTQAILQGSAAVHWKEEGLIQVATLISTLASLGT